MAAAAAPSEKSKLTSEVDLSGFGLERVQHIGRGQYASAQLVRETATGQMYVAKCISMAALGDHDQDLAHQEVFLLQTLSHSYIVAYRGSFLIEEVNTLVIVMEYCAGGDLRKCIKDKAKSGERFPEEQVMTWFVQLCLALQYIHSEKVLHRDLKTSNIFLAEGGSMIKLGDFGISRVLDGSCAVTIVGTPYYMSPEVCRSEPYNWKSDVWALGCVLYELCMLKHAFESSSLLGLVYKIVSDHYEPIPDCYSPQLNDLIRQLLMKNADERPSINELFANPYVKAYLAKQSVPPAGPPLAKEPLNSRSAPRVTSPTRRATLRPGAARDARPAPPAAPAEPPQMGPNYRVLLIGGRIRRRLLGQKLNWISSCAQFDEDGDGSLSVDSMGNALTSMSLGLSEEEIAAFTTALAQSPSGKISLDAFSAYLEDVAAEVQQCEAWGREVLAPAGRRLRELLRCKDSQGSGTLPVATFTATLMEVAPGLTPEQLDLLVVLADKNGLGDVDYTEFAELYGPPPVPQPQVQNPPAPGSPTKPAAPPGMPPLPGGPPAPPLAPPGMPPLPGAGGGGAPSPLGVSTTDLGDINLERTYFTCASAAFLGQTQGSARPSTLTQQGAAIIFSRMRRRLDAVSLPIADALSLFTVPGEQELTAEQLLDAAASLPLGISRAEMQQMFLKVDTEGAGKVALSALTTAFSRASPSQSSTAPSWISAAMQRGLCGRIQEALTKLGGAGGSRSLAREVDFRRVVMQTERYLTSDQLNWLVLLTDKSADGNVDFDEFAARFDPAGAGAAALGVPGGVCPAAAEGGAAASDEEILVVAARTGAVLDRHGLAPERVPALLALWGGGLLQNSQAAAALASLPIGLSRLEAHAQLGSAGGAAAFAARLGDLRAQGVWRSHCDWAAANVSGEALRAVLQSQVIEAESRALEPGEFIRTLTDAGVAPDRTEMVLWLAEKTAQGDIRIAEFLACFGGPPPVETKKKRGMFWRIVGR